MHINAYMDNGVLVRVCGDAVEFQNKGRFLHFSFEKAGEFDDCLTVSIQRTYEDPQNHEQFTSDTPIKVAL